MGIQCTKSYEQILSTLMAATNEYSNYGLLFGLSNIIANDLKFTKSSNIDGNIKSIVESQTDLEFFDICYPCFTSAYASQANQNFSKQVSYSLAKYAIDKLEVSGTMNLLNIRDLNEFETQFVLIKNSWLTSLNSSIILTPNEIPIAFAYTGEQVPLSFMSNVAIYHLSRGYKDFLSSSFKGIPYFNENVLITDYVNTILVLRILEEDMAVRYNMLKRDIDYPRLTVNLVAEGAINNSYYNTGTTRVFVNSVIALVHEYSHYITLYKANIPFSVVAEAVIDYFDFFMG